MNKVVVLSNMYPSVDHPTYGIFVENQVELLKSNGIDVKVIAISNPGKGKMTTLIKYMSWFFQSFFYMTKNRKKLSLSHAHYAFPTGLISLLGKRVLGIPFVVTVHGGDIDKMAAKSRQIAKLTRLILNEAATVIVVGEKLKDDVTGRFGVPENRVEVMSMGVDTEVFKPIAKIDARQQLGLPSSGKIILYVGNIIEAKGLLELIEAYKYVVKEYPEASLYLIGSTKDTGFNNRLALHSIENNVEIIQQTPKPQTEIAKWMSAADVFVLPSHHEGFGLVALEAMAAGTSVVGSDVGGLSYLLKDHAGILVKPRDSKSLAAGLREALEPTSKEIDKAVCDNLVDDHSFETIVNRLLRIYKSVGKN